MTTARDVIARKLHDLNDLGCVMNGMTRVLMWPTNKSPLSFPPRTRPPKLAALLNPCGRCGGAEGWHLCPPSGS